MFVSPSTVVFSTVGVFTASLFRALFLWEFEGDVIVAVPVALFCIVAIVGNCLMLFKALRERSGPPSVALWDDDRAIARRKKGGIYPAIRNFVAFGFGVLLYISIIQSG